MLKIQVWGRGRRYWFRLARNWITTGFK